MGTQDPRRAAKFLSQRACELVGRDSDVGRRARILNVRGAVSEAAGLSRAFAEAGGVTQPNEEPARAGHGIATLPDVIDEAQRLLSEDVVLRERAPALHEHVRGALDRVRGAALQQPKPNVRDAHVRALETVRDELESSYLGHTLDAVTELTLQRSEALLELESAVQSLVTDLRARGWSDPKLTAAFKLLDSDAPADALAAARNQFTGAVRTFTCYVPVSSLQSLAGSDDLRRAARLVSLDDVPPGAKKAPCYVCVEVRGVDPAFVARVANERAAAVVGAMEIFAPYLRIEGPTVIVVDGGQREVVQTSADAHIRLLPGRGFETDELARAAESAWKAAEANDSDALSDAVRHRERALRPLDTESRFMLLWLGIERLVSGSRDHRELLSAVCALLPKAIVLGRLRREVTALAGEIARHDYATSEREELRALVGTPERVVEAHRLLGTLLGADDPRCLLRFFYERDPRLVQWFVSLKKTLGGGDTEKLVAYHASSLTRLTWHVKRLYRARNNIAHAGRGPAWLTDLVVHTLRYLTELIAIVLHYRSRTPARSAVEILSDRAMQYDVFVDLLGRGYARATDLATLLRPTRLFAPET